MINYVHLHFYILLTQIQELENFQKALYLICLGIGIQEKQFQINLCSEKGRKKIKFISENMWH